jgi:Helicase associated domain/Helicase conserved C-terminal domain
VDDQTYRTYAEQGELVTRDGKKITDARTLASQIGLAKTMRKYGLRRIVSFHGRVESARAFSAEMPDVIDWMPSQARPAGQLWSHHVSAKNMTSGHRDRLLLRFRDLEPDERGLLSNARCLGEGVDVPSIDGVAFVNPRRSTIDIVQAVGRAIRKSPDKKLGTIVLPVFLSEGEDPDLVLDESAFKHVWDVLKALRAHDEALGEELDDLRRRLGARRAPPRRPGKIKLDLPADRVGAAFAFAFNARLIEHTTASWEFYYGLLQDFVEREGHARVPTDYRDDDGKRLGLWVVRQRYGQGALDPERRARLETVPGWTWKPRVEDWAAGFAHLQDFVEHEGHARVPDNHTENDFNLGAWVGKQRASHRQATLRPERRRRLEVLPGWTWDALTASWDEDFAVLQAFVEREGHARVPRGWHEQGFRLGQWVVFQRTTYKKGSFDLERRARLQALPAWTWDPFADAWEEGFAHLQRFVEHEGHALGA